LTGRYQRPSWCKGYAAGTLPYYATGTPPVRYRICYRRVRKSRGLEV